MTISEFIYYRKSRLEGRGPQCANPILQLKQLVQFALGIDSTNLYAQWEQILTPLQMDQLEKLVERRCSGEPFQYITGVDWFWESPFRVGPGVLIPRKETEHLVETTLKWEGKLKVAELGAGSGNIGISVLKERPRWKWYAYEKSSEALAYARVNAEQLSKGNEYHLIHGDFFELTGTFDAIVSNPPYVANTDRNSLAKEVLHEPDEALFGGKEGLEVILRLIQKSRDCLRPGGNLAFEIGLGQSTRVKAMLADYRYSGIEILPDYAGIPRIAVATFGV